MEEAKVVEAETVQVRPQPITKNHSKTKEANSATKSCKTGADRCQKNSCSYIAAMPLYLK